MSESMKTLTFVLVVILTVSILGRLWPVAGMIATVLLALLGLFYTLAALWIAFNKRS
jgi:hypothetical protein